MQNQQWLEALEIAMRSKVPIYRKILHGSQKSQSTIYRTGPTVIQNDMISDPPTVAQIEGIAQQDTTEIRAYLKKKLDQMVRMADGKLYCSYHLSVYP